jgi:FkbM family methyltransferase
MKSFRYKYGWDSREEWFLPDDELMMQNQFPIMDEQISSVLEHTPFVRTCIQAGGAFGMYPLRLSHYFDQVITFEPLLANLQCMAVNLNNVENVTVEEYALWNESDIDVKMAYSKPNKNSYGAHHVATTGVGQSVTTVTVDQYHLPTVDLLWLDVEGAEIFALQGAEKTIDACRPVVVVEQRQLRQMRQLGVTANDAVSWMRNHWKYKVVGNAAADIIMVPE